MSETWITGINPVDGVLNHDASRVRELRIERGSRNPRVAELIARARKQGISVSECGREQLERLAEGSRHQGVAACCLAAEVLGENDLPGLVARADGAALFLVLDGVTDPHNLGACLRSAAAAGSSAVIVPKDRAVGITPVVRRASAGAADRVPLVVATNLARALRTLKDAGVWLTGFAGEAKTELYDIDLKGPCALVLGSEGEGMRRLTRDSCDFLARIDMPGAMESLNVSVSAGIALFEALRQRRG